MEVQWKCSGSEMEVQWKCSERAGESAELFRVCTKSGNVPTQFSLVSVCFLGSFGVGVGEFGLENGIYGRFCLV